MLLPEHRQAGWKLRPNGCEVFRRDSLEVIGSAVERERGLGCPARDNDPLLSTKLHNGPVTSQKSGMSSGMACDSSVLIQPLLQSPQTLPSCKFSKVCERFETKVPSGRV